jgi:hypothetical protein
VKWIIATALSYRENMNTLSGSGQRMEKSWTSKPKEEDVTEGRVCKPTSEFDLFGIRLVGTTHCYVHNIFNILLPCHGSDSIPP